MEKTKEYLIGLALITFILFIIGLILDYELARAIDNLNAKQNDLNDLYCKQVDFSCNANPVNNLNPLKIVCSCASHKKITLNNLGKQTT